LKKEKRFKLHRQCEIVNANNAMQGVQIFSSTPGLIASTTQAPRISPVATPAPSTARTDFLVPSTTDESCHRSGKSTGPIFKARLGNRTHGRDGVGRFSNTA
jgi:hypothetical protein